MKKQFSNFFRYFLSMALIISSVPLLPVNNLYAESKDSVEKTIDDELNELKSNLYDENGVKKPGALDPFLLLTQSVPDEKAEKIKLATKQALIDDYNERVQFYKDKIIGLGDMLKQIEVKLEKLNLSSDSQSRKSEKRNQITEITNDIISRIKIYELELEDLKQFNPELGEALPLEHMVDQSYRKKHYWGNKLQVKIKSGSRSVGTIYQKDFTQSLAVNTNIEDKLADLRYKDKLSFTLTNPKGYELNVFDVDLESIFFYGQYLVYVEKNSYSEETQVLPIRFIDLNFFKSNLGNAPLPVYTLPLKVSKENYQNGAKEFGIKNGKLNIYSELSYHQFAVLGQVHQMIFNVGVGLVDSSTYKQTLPLVKQIVSFFGKSMKAQEKLFSKGMAEAIDSDSYLNGIMQGYSEFKKQKSNSAELLEKALEDKKISNDEYEQIKSGFAVNGKMKEINTALYASRQFFTRIRLMAGNLFKPRPEGSPKLLNSILIAMTKGKLPEISTKVTKLKVFGAAAGGALLASTMLPESHVLHISQSVDFIGAIFEHFQGYLQHIDYGKNYAVLSKDAFMTSMKGLTSFQMFDAYIVDGKWKNFGYGLTQVLIFFGKVFATMHVTVNTVKILKNTIDYRKKNTIVDEIEINRFFRNHSKKRKPSLIKSFIESSQEDKRRYWEIKAESEKQASGSDINDISDEQVELLEEHIKRLKAGEVDDKSLNKTIKKMDKESIKFLSGFKEVREAKVNKENFVSELVEVIDEESKKLNKVSETNFLIAFASAIKHSYLSYSALAKTFTTNTALWNVGFILRSYTMEPSKWLMGLIYPNYFTTAASTLDGSQVMPTKYNAGLNSWPQKISRLASKAGVSKITGKVPLLKNLFLSKEALANLKAFEASVAPLEEIAMKIALKKAQLALLESIDDPQRALKLYSSSEFQNPLSKTVETSTGISNLYSKKIKLLTPKEKIYYRAYYTRTFDLVMKEFLSDLVLAPSEKEIDNPERFSAEFIKLVKTEQLNNFSYDQSEIKAIEESLESRINWGTIEFWVEDVSTKFSEMLKKVNINFRLKLLESIQPKNPQVNRYLVSKHQSKDPRAVDRAVRMEVSTLLSSIPLGIITTLIMYAGVNGGMIQPFDNAGLDTETHYKYMSRYLFYNGFIPGLLIGFMANTWMKLQTDYRLAQSGSFEKAIMHSDGQKGFWRYYAKNLFKNPENKWIDNHTYMLRLIWANVPAAIPLMVASNLFGLGRLDIGAFVAGYIIVYTSFLYGFNTKIDQAFEKSSAWVESKIPRKLRAHPEAQKYIGNSIQKKKILFTFYENIWSIVVNQNIAGTMLTLKENTKIGSRAFLRLIFGGETPTQLLVNFSDKMIEAFNKVPGVESSLEFFKNLISNNYEAFERYPERLIEQGQGVERLYENPNLPKNIPAEIIGKMGGAVASISAFTIFPYIGAYIIDIFTKNKVQKNGQALSEKAVIKEKLRRNKAKETKAIVKLRRASCAASLN